jgi:hypothetical protein
MELAKLILNFISSLVWPSVALIIVLLFRKQIRGRFKDIQTIELPGIKATLNSEKVKAIIEETASEISASGDNIEKGFISKQFKRIAVQIDNPDTSASPALENTRESAIDDGSRTMLAFATGDSMQDNLTYNIYYDPADRTHSKPFQYIGLYADMGIVAVGKVIKIVTCDYADEKLFGTLGYDISTLTPDEYNRIKLTIENTKAYEDELDSGLRFFLVDKFCATSYLKTSSYAIRSKRYFWLDEIDGFKQGMSSENLAQFLNGKTWE